MEKVNVLKEVQKVVYELLKEVDRICKIHNINYILYAGTLLGAIRHEGFIPWDDDIDVAMLRNDYEKFLKIAKKEMNPKYHLQHYKYDKKSFYTFTKIRKNNTLFIEKSTKKVNMHHGIFIDVFPLDNYLANEKVNKKIRGYFRLKSVSHLPYTYIKERGIITEIIKLFFRIFRLPRTFYNKKIDQLSARDNNKESIYVNCTTIFVGDRLITKKEYIADTKRVLFVEDYFPVPKNYHNLLTTLYGDYMKIPPIEKRRIPHATKISFDGKKIFEGYE